MNERDQALRELAIRELERRHEAERSDLLEFIKYYFEQEHPGGITEFNVAPFHKIIADRLHQCLERKITRLIINIPPGHGKSELVSRCFPVFAIGNDPYTKIIATSYSGDTAMEFADEARNYYKSDTFKKIFPRNEGISKSTKGKKYRKTAEGGAYYSAGIDGAITSKRCRIFLIDDPIKPKEANNSEIVRSGVNTTFKNTVPSRLFNPETDCIIIIMQRTHDDDLSGHLIERMDNGGEKWEVLSMPAIAEEDEIYETRYGVIERKKGEPLDAFRFPLSALSILRKGTSPQVWSCQYQQQPVNKETQEFHEERFMYHGEGSAIITPNNLRIFTAVDPAFKKGQENDNTSIITAGFDGDKMYILEYTAGKFGADEMQSKIIYHIRKRNPEKVGIEAYQAQSMIITFLKNELNRLRIYCNIEEITQSGDKLTKIRKLITLYRNGMIFHKRGMDELEAELKRFPRGKHDDIIDSEQMLYSMYELQPNTIQSKMNIQMEYDKFGRPVIAGFNDDQFFNE